MYRRITAISGIGRKLIDLPKRQAALATLFALAVALMLAQMAGSAVPKASALTHPSGIS